MSTTITRSASASPSLHSVVDPSLFPLKSIADVVNFFRRSLEQSVSAGTEPDLTLLSIVAGFVELSLTTGEAAQAAAVAVSAAEHTTAPPPPPHANILAYNSTAAPTDIIMGNSVPFPVVTHDLVVALYKKFQSILSVVEKPKTMHRQATREIIKKVSDVIWNSLIRSTYKDRAHLQNLYSYLSGNKLDSFGVALAVVAGCQLLGYRDVRLAISEDHAWIVFGGKRAETVEVTWHGKGSEDKRGQDITAGVESAAWLYLSGLAVICEQRYMEVAAIVLAINFSLPANSDCLEIMELQQKLLWLLYDMGYLKKYPMAIGTLGELEELNSTHSSINCEQLYKEAIEAARNHYHNHHVYPYTYLGYYYHRQNKYRDAFQAWANAADVIRLYTYSCRDDEEIYKELLDIANETIPCVMKAESSGHSARSILRDSEVFANLLRFYDGICQWEEDSLTPILHIGWAKPLVTNITKFDYDIRSQVVIKLPEEIKTELQQANNKATETAMDGKEATTVHMEASKNHALLEGNNNHVLKKDEKCATDVGNVKEIPKTLADLTAACGEKILNPDFLLQGGDQPFFAEQKQQQHHLNNNVVCETNGTAEKQIVEKQPEKLPHAITNNGSANTLATNSTTALNTPIVEEEDPFEFMLKRPVITLYSEKMKGLKDLLLAEKLNTHAISLQVTAHSVASRKVRGVDKLGNHTTNSTYATVNIAAAASVSATGTSNAGNATAAATAIAADSIAASRPKRTRRE